MKIFFDPSDFPTWQKPGWVDRGWTTIPKWLIDWVIKPCPALYLGPKEELFTLYLLFNEYYPGAWIEQAQIFELSTYRGFEETEEARNKWGSFLPGDVKILFITDMDPPFQHHLVEVVENLVRTRKGERKLTVVHSNLDFQNWCNRVIYNSNPIKDPLKIGLPLVIQNGK